MFLTHHVAAIDRMRALPGARTAGLRTGDAEPDDDPAVRMEAEEAVRADCAALASLLARSWGEPELVDLTEHLVRQAEGEALPEPLRTLCGAVTELRVWTVEGRWTGIGVARGGAGLPPQLVAAVGEEGAPAPSGPGRAPGSGSGSC